MALTAALLRSTCKLLVGAMLFAQMAIAAHACGGLSFAPADADVTAAAQDMPPDCEMLQSNDANKGNLCVEHCRFGQQSADTALPPAVTAAVPVLLYALPQLDIASGPPIARAMRVRTVATAPPEPVHAVAHCVWRI
jgi:hypothetical protein